MATTGRFLFQCSFTSLSRQIRCCEKIASTSKVFLRKPKNALLSCSRGFSSYPPHEIVPMPSLSPTMEAGAIAKWNKEEGEEFIAGDILCEVETDKATVDFEAQDDGFLAKILEVAGSAEIICGVPICITVEEGDDVAAFKDYSIEGSGEEGKLGLTVEKDIVQDAAASTAVAVVESPAAAAASSPAGAGPGGVLASPKAHMMSKQLGYDISKIVGTGPGGRILAADVQEYTPAAAVEAAPVPTAAAIPAPTVTSAHTDYPLSQTAQDTASLLTLSKSTVPHYYLSMDLNLTSLLSLRTRLNGKTSSDISVNDFLLKTIATTTKSVPDVNASWISNDFIRMYHDVHINTLVGTGDQLQMVLLRDVDKRGLSALSNDLSTILDNLSTQQSIPSHHQGMGTFTMLNLGMYGVSNAASIIPSPQSCVLTVGTAELKIIPSDKEECGYTTATIMSVTLSCDHRVVDGAVAAQWLSAYKNLIENPDLLLL